MSMFDNPDAERAAQKARRALSGARAWRQRWRRRRIDQLTVQRMVADARSWWRLAVSIEHRRPFRAGL